MGDEIFDLLIVGGGINGAGIARDAAGRGLSVLLVEAEDLAQHTSSASTKLIHGGLRYLEYGEFRLVREALIERERLMRIAPHIIWPLRFVLPQQHSPRPAWMVRLGLFLYDHIGGRRSLPGTETIRLDRSPLGAGLVRRGGRGFVYSDCWVDDSRLVVLNARDAADRGAAIRTRTRLVASHREGSEWIATLEERDGGRQTVRARALVNAAGPWVSDVLARIDGSRAGSTVRLVKGSHLVVPRLYEGEQAFLLQNPDRRVVFAIPYLERFTLVGTTDVDWRGPPAAAAISESETEYLLDTISRYFQRAVAREEIVSSYAGIRPLYDDKAAGASAVTRDYVLDLDAEAGQAPLLSIFGGKITTYRKLAEHALRELAPHLPRSGPAWTATAPLPGGDLPDGDIERLRAELGADYPGMPSALLDRLARLYGTRARCILRSAATTADLGGDLGAGLTPAEVDYLVDVEWARSPEDILMRRTKVGIDSPAGLAARVANHLAARESGRVEGIAAAPV